MFSSSEPLDAESRRLLSATIEESPENAISLHVLRAGEGYAYASGPATNPTAALVGWDELPEEPEGFGEAEGIVDLLGVAPTWRCILVDSAIADRVDDLVRARFGRPTRRVTALYYELRTAPALPPVDEVRLLGPADAELLRPHADVLDAPDPEQLLATRIIAGAICDGRVVATARNSASSARYADVGVVTVEQWRGRGFAAAATALVAQALQNRGLIPVWSTGESNVASQRVAEKVGFAKVGERTYIVLAGET